MTHNIQQVQMYQSEDGLLELKVAFGHETVWLTQAQMAELFDTSTDNVGLHLKHIYAEQELDELATTEDFSVVRQEGNRQVQRQIKHYHLDAVISVGYRVSSSRATQFRIWATRTLKQYLVNGYTLNQSRLQDRGIEFEQVRQLLPHTLTHQQRVQPEGSAILSVIADYARSWSLLQGYDQQSLNSLPKRQTGMQTLHLPDVLVALRQLKATLMAKGEASEWFGQLRGEGLASVLATIEQGFGDEWFYPHVASRAAHLLYFVIKNHPLADGNKRCGVFLWYLRLN